MLSLSLMGMVTRNHGLAEAHAPAKMLPKEPSSIFCSCRKLSALICHRSSSRRTNWKSEKPSSLLPSRRKPCSAAHWLRGSSAQGPGLDGGDNALPGDAVYSCRNFPGPPSTSAAAFSIPLTTVAMTVSGASAGGDRVLDGYSQSVPGRLKIRETE